MSSLFRDSSAAWAALIIIALPLLIVGAGEVEERLRQRDSQFQPALSTIRVWVVPLLTLWVLARALFEVSADNLLMRILGSAVLLSAASAAVSGLRVVVSQLADRPRQAGRRPIPRLVLVLPRLLLILTTAWILIAGIWGVDLSAALTALGVGSLVISLALQDTLSGVASGFTLLADQPFAVGDWIESEEVEGRVTDVSWRATRIKDRNGDLRVIPNSHLATVPIINFDQPSRLHRVVVPVQIERTAPPTAAIAMLVDAARSTPGVVEDPSPFARVTQIADPVVDYEAYMWVDDYTVAKQVKADFGALVWYFSYRHDVPLPNPAQDLYLFDGAKTAVEGQVTAADIRRRLVGMPLFADVDDSVLDQLAGAASLDQFQRGETIVAEGTQHDLRLLDEGRARLLLRQDDSEDLNVLDIESGEVFGVPDEPSESDRRALVIAVTDCDVVTIPPEAAARAVSLAPDLAAVLEQVAVTRSRRVGRVLRRAGRTALSTRSAADSATPGDES